MTPRQRFLTALRREQPDRVPYGIGAFNREALRKFKEKTGTDDTDAYFGVDNDIELVGFKETGLDVKERFLKYHALPQGVTYSGIYDMAGFARTDTGQKKLKVEPNEFYLNEWGIGYIVGSDVAYDHFIPPAVMTKTNSLKDIEEYPMPDFSSDCRHKHLEEDVKKIKKKDLAVGATMEMTVFEVAWQVRGFDQLMIDFFTNEDMAACLLDRITEISCSNAKIYAAAGVDIIRMGDDIGMEDRMLMSPEMWRKWLKPRLARVIKSAKDVNPDVLICYHSDGFVEPVIGELNEIGVDVLNPLQPEAMDPAHIKNKYGDRLAFWGSLGIQHTLPFGSVQDVEAEVKERIETVGKGGGLYLSPTHCIAPEVPYENLFAFVAAAKKYGKYD